MEPAQNSTNLNDLFTNEAYREFLDSKLYYTDKLPEAHQMQLRALMVPDNPNPFTDYLNKLIEYNLLSQEDVEDNIRSILITIITNVLRPILYNTLSELNEDMGGYGQFIISGGEAFNLNVKKEYRKLTPDIDTKFIPFFDKKIPSEAQYVGSILKIKEYFWYDVLEKAVQKLNDGYDDLYSDVLKPLENCPEFRLFTFRFRKPKKILGKKRGKDDDDYDYTPPFRKRYTLITKKKGEKDMFYDLNLFAIDLFVEQYKFFPVNLEPQRIGTGNKLKFAEGSSIDGVLDLAFMRPGQFGYEVSEPGNNTVISVSSLPVDDKEYEFSSCLTKSMNTIFTDKKVRIASSKFLGEDIEAMVQLKLRPGKSSKDLYRQMIIQYDNYYKKLYTKAIKYCKTFEEATEYAHNIGEVYKLAYDYAIRNNATHGIAAKYAMTTADKIKNRIPMSEAREYVIVYLTAYDYAIRNNATHEQAVKYAMTYADKIRGGSSPEEATKYAQQKYLEYSDSEEGEDEDEDEDEDDQAGVEEIIIQPPNLKTQKFNAVFYRDNINSLSISKVLRLIAPPKIPELNQEGLFEMKIITDKFNQAQRNENGIPLSEAEKFLPPTTVKYLTNDYERDYIQEADWQKVMQSISSLVVEETTGIRYDLSQKTWIESCCETEPENITCCDPIGNQFKFRINSQQLGFWLFTGTPKFKEIIQEIFQHISNHIDEIQTYIDNGDIETAKDKIGMMFYEYNPTYKANIDITALLSNVLIIFQSLRYVEGDLEEFINSNIISKLLDMRVKLLKITSEKRPAKCRLKTIKEDTTEDIPTLTFMEESIVYKAMSLNQKDVKYNKMSFYTSQLDTAEEYANTEQDWVIFECKLQKNVNLVDLSNQENLEKLIYGKTGILSLKLDRDILAFMFGYKMTSKQQYDEFKKHKNTYNPEPYDLIPGLTESSLSTDDEGYLKRCSIYQLDEAVLSKMCNKIKHLGKKSKIQGFYIPGGIPTNYCIPGSKICNGIWHDEIILCDSSDAICNYKDVEEIEQLLVKGGQQGKKRLKSVLNAKNTRGNEEEDVEKDIFTKKYNELIAIGVTHDQAIKFAIAYSNAFEIAKANNATDEQADAFAIAKANGYNDEQAHAIALAEAN